MIDRENQETLREGIKQEWSCLEWHCELNLTDLIWFQVKI